MEFICNTLEPQQRDLRKGETSLNELIEKNKTRNWHRNTDLCVDVKTFLFSSRIAEIGKDYQGILTHDQEDHFNFVETEAEKKTHNRNPKVFKGKYITVTRKPDGTYRTNFKLKVIDGTTNIRHLALGVCAEILNSLRGLIEK